MMRATRYKKLYYVPGLLSLLLVPLLFILIALEQNRKLDKRVLEVNAWHPDLEKYFPFPERNYKQVKLTRDAEQNEAAIASARAFTKQLYANEDTINGIRYNFQDASYGTYVSILNSLKIDSTTYSAIYGNSIWVLNRPKSVETEPFLMICGNSSQYFSDNASTHMSFSEKVENYLTPYQTGAAILWPALTLLMLLTVLSLKQTFHKKPIP